MLLQRLIVAAVLAVPRTLDSGAPFPDRDLIVLVTCGVIVLTLLQALLLPSVVRFARLPADASVTEELHLAEQATLDAAIERLADRHPGECADALACGQSLLQGFRLHPGLLGGNSAKGQDAAVDLFNPLQRALDHLDRRDLAASDERRDRSGIQLRECIVHESGLA